MTIDLLHRPLHDLRISVTDRCNFRCGYCMPKDKYGRDHSFLPRKALLSYEEIETIAHHFIELGVVKIRLTGGEPLLRKDLEHLVKRLANLPGLEDLSLTTNASLLDTKRADALLNAGLRRINISLDAIDDTTFKRLNGLGYPVKQVLAGIEHARTAGFEQIKINMVVQKGVNENAILPMIDYFLDRGVILRFIEYMDVGNSNHWQRDDVFSASQIKTLIETCYPIKPLQANYRGEVAKRWTISNSPLEIGLIASVTEPFCGECSRARLSAIGEVYTCLFANHGHDLRKFLRTDKDPQALRAAIARIWNQRTDRYSAQRSSHKPVKHKVEMSYIGG